MKLTKKCKSARRKISAGIMACLLAVGPLTLPAAQTVITKADTTTMNLAADWGGTAPAAAIIGSFDGTISAAHEAALTLGGNIQLDALQFLGTLNGPVTIGASSGSTLTLGAASGTSGIDMSAANFDVTVNCALNMNSAQAFNVAASRNLNVGSMISGSGKDLTKTGAGTLTLYGGSSGSPGLVGWLNASAGTLNVSGYLNPTVASGGKIQVSGGTLNISGTVTTSGHQYFGVGDGISGTVNITGGTTTAHESSSIFVGKSGVTGNLNVSGGTFSLPAGSIYVAASYNDSADSANTVGNISISGSALFDTGTSVDSFKLGNGTVSSIKATVNLDGGTLATARSIATSDSRTTSTFNFNGGTLKARGTGLAMSGLTAANVRNGGAVIDSGGFAITLAQSLVHSTVGGDNATDGGLTKNGGGTLALSGANTFNGGLTVNSGTVSFAGDGTSGGQPLGAYPGSTSPANVTLNGGELLDTTTATIAANRGITLGSSGGTLDASAGQTLTINGIIAGTGALTKGASSGALTLNGPNTYSGVTTVSGGTLNFKGNNSISSSGNSAVQGGSTVTVDPGAGGTFASSGRWIVGYNYTAGTMNFNSGTSTFTANDQFNLCGQAYCNGTVNVNSGATLNLNLANATYGISFPTAAGSGVAGSGQYNAGIFNVSGGTVNIGSTPPVTIAASSYNHGSLNISSGFLTVNGTGSFKVADNATGCDGTINLDGGTFATYRTITGGAGQSTNNFNGGTLTAGRAMTLFAGMTALNVRNNGVIINDGGFAVSVGGALLHSPISGDNAVDGGLTKQGAGVLTLSAVNAYSGNTTISAGKLALSGSGSIASTTIAVTNNAMFDVSAITPVGYTLPGSLRLHLNRTGSTLTQGQMVIGAKNLVYAGSLTVTKTGDALANGDSFTLVTKSTGTLGGWFSSVSLPLLSSGLSWDTNNLATAGVLDVYTFTTTPLALSTPTGTAATISAAKLANHATSSRQASPYPGGWTATATTPVNGGSVVVNGNSSFTYTPAGAANVNGGTDSFTMTFSDGHGTQTMAVSVAVGTSGSGGQSPNVLVSGTDGAGKFYALFAGLPNTAYTVETNSVMSGGTWVKYANYPTGNNGLINVTNVPPVTGSLFFRTVYPGY